MNEILGQVTLDDLSISTILINLSVGIILSIALKLHFEKFSSTLSGKKELAQIIPFLVLIVCLVISIVKSSLALSLGLVGALSIVRFRTPIKEPEELVYLFMCIAIGLGLGANQTGLTVITSLFILGTTAIYKWKFVSAETKNLYLNLSWTETKDNPVAAKDIGELIASKANKADLKRHDINGEDTQLVYFVDINSVDTVYDTVDSIKKRYPHINTSFIDQSRIPGI